MSGVFFNIVPKYNDDCIAVIKGGSNNKKFVSLTTKTDSTAHETYTDGIDLPIGSEFKVLPNAKTADRIYVVGSSNSGKSTWTASYINEFLNVFVGSRVVFICPDDITKDPAYEKVADEMLQVFPEELVENPLSFKNFIEPDELLGENTPQQLVVFDDVESVDEEQKGLVLGIMKQLLQRGRKFGISVVYISHRGADSNNTKVILGELNGVVFPVLASASHNLTYLLKNHLQINPVVRSEMKKKAEEFGRMAFIRCDSFIRYCVSGKKIFAVDDDKIDRAKVVADKMMRAKIAGSVRE